MDYLRWQSKAGAVEGKHIGHTGVEGVYPVGFGVLLKKEGERERGAARRKDEG